MTREIQRSVGNLPDRTLNLLHEAAEAEDRLREIGIEIVCIRTILDRQLHHELAKLAARGVSTEGALQLEPEDRAPFHPDNLKTFGA